MQKVQNFFFLNQEEKKRYEQKRRRRIRTTKRMRIINTDIGQKKGKKIQIETTKGLEFKIINYNEE